MTSAYHGPGPVNLSRAHFRHQLCLERLEHRRLMAGDMLNSLATGDQTSLLNRAGETELIARFTPAVGPKFHLPVDGLDPVDASMGVALGAADSAPFALSQTFLLHSNAGATKVIYLDFNGHTTTGTQWNTTYNNGAAIVTPAYSVEGDSSFSDTELERIQQIWERVAEDYIPFDVDVTTEDPGVEALRDGGGSDTRWGVRVVIGGSSNDWFGSSAGGVAYVGSFDWNSDTPCFVFEEQLANGNEKYTAEAASHEIGHTLGLSHDGTSSAEYYQGHGSGATGWAPIMGLGYYQELTQWSNGQYPSATQTQDDLAIITGSNGFSYRADDYGSTIATASALNVSGTVVSSSGIIERTTDVDYFVFSTQGATINLDINPFYRSPNLDVLATLYNSAGSIIATSNPVLALGANFSLLVGAGTYYLSVDGTGKSASGSDYGYSDYGSLGYYTITGSIMDTTTPGIDLYGTTFSINLSNFLGSGGFVDTSFSVTNHGDTAAGAFDVKFYLSDDATIDPASDILLTLDSSSVYYDSAEPTAYHVAGLASLSTNSPTVRLTVPLNDPFGTDSQYYVGMIVDADGNITEANESNNRNLGDGIDRESVTYALDFRNPTPVTIPASGGASAYPSNIIITGLTGMVTDVNVSFFGITHTLPDDLDVLLVGPAGQKVVLMSDAGGNSDISGVNLVLDDDATNFLPNSARLASGSFKPTSSGSGDTFTSPAPAGPYGSLLTAFQGTNPNGTWSLYVLDDAANNSGSFSGGWGLTFTLSNSSPTNPANVALATIDEDITAISNMGSSVTSIVLSSGSSDPDGNALGIAVTSTDNMHGQWQYSSNGGSSWQNLSNASASAAWLLAPTYNVRFLPNADFNSQIASQLPTFAFKTWDQTFGAASGAADTTVGNAFSTATALATQSVAALNDPPIFGLASTLVTVPEDAGAVSVNAFATNMASGPASATD
nr:proprotein convertase P-domain-containing protein [Pirellulales bacterium]